MARKTATDVTTTRKQVPARSLSIADHKYPLLTIIDGLTSYKSYVVAAQLGSEPMVAVKKLNDYSGPEYKVKFYPTIAAFFPDSANVDSYSIPEALIPYGAYNRRFRPDLYDRVFIKAEGFQKLMDDLRARKTEGIVAATVANVDAVLLHKDPEDETIEEIVAAPMSPSKRKSAPSPQKKPAARVMNKPVPPARSNKTPPVAAKKVAPKPMPKPASKAAAAPAKPARKAAAKKAPARNKGKILSSRPKYKGMDE